MNFSPSSLPLRTFLSHAKNQLSAAIQRQQKVTIVIGNESADLDSLSSSILYAYLRTIHPPQAAFTQLYIPLLNIPASDVPLRPEFTAVFEHADISASHLITLDDLPSFNEIGKRLRPANTSWILVDHNKLQGILGTLYQSRVQGVIDHHEEENAYCEDDGPEPRVIEKCGSCTSLVVRASRATWDNISGPSPSADTEGESFTTGSEANYTNDRKVAKLALASILIDTANLNGEGKVEPADIEAVEYLEAKMNLFTKTREKWDRTSFYAEINEARTNIDSLSLPEILRKDYKQWIENTKTLGISSVVKPLSFLVTKATSETQRADEKDAFLRAIHSFMSSKNLSVFAIMTTTTSPAGTFQRELLLQTSPTDADFLSRFAERASPELGLEKLAVESLPESATRAVWRLKDASKSRKQVAPLLRETMR